MVIRWGDPVLDGAPPYDPRALTAEGQAKQCGFNCDYIDYFPLPAGSDASDHGLLCVNHDYTNTNLMFAGIGEGRAARSRTNKEQAAIEIAAHGVSVVEVRREGGVWRSVPGGRYNRRITMETPMRISGPATGLPRMRTGADPAGTQHPRPYRGGHPPRRWPDVKQGEPPRRSVIAIVKRDGGVIGS
jgi:secreted PhoX family phosphatase